MTKEEATIQLQGWKYLFRNCMSEEKGEALSMAIEALRERSKGKWVKKPHKIYLPRDCEPDITDYYDRQYNEEDHSIIQYWWYCNQCDYEADRWMKPTFNFCPNCGVDMREVHDD